MKSAIILIRSTLFNLSFYGGIALMCVVCLPGIFLPRRNAMSIVRLFVGTVYFFEKYLLGLDFEVRGRENLPSSGAFIVAAKHQSPYETMKLNIIFDDPAIVLKQELLKIPLWGKFLAKADPIAINRNNPRESIRQIIDGAIRVGGQGRPIIIFPQGTRVHTWETTADKPYKTGVARIREATGLPLIPMALNSGYFWPRRGWIKKQGTVVFQFLAPVPIGLNVDDTIKDIESRLESASNALLREAEKSP